MKNIKWLIALFGILTLNFSDAQEVSQYSGFFDFSWESSSGKIWMDVDKVGEEFLYVNSLPAGIGSNDIGLDRGQLGGERVVRFERSGPKLLLTESNYGFRANSDNAAERKAVKEAFAESVLWGFKIEEKNGKEVIDITSFLLRDAHGVVNRLQRNNQGSYKLDASRSAIYLDRTKNFPDNTEFEATITFTGTPKGAYIRSVAPSADAVTVRMHHSFVRLPDNNYQVRKFDPRSGFYPLSFYDYASPISAELETRYTVRHRLNKKNPNAAKSEAVEPIIYYIDPGCPEPIKSALMEGASWWNQAFEAAGYINAFQVKELPEGADPMDVRYNLIQWVHRSTRGWSYGASVSDPRTGEIIKGHVSLGSLRVRQDYLIAQGIEAAFKGTVSDDDPLLQMALARLRQLAAHEVGHTIGLQHNFAASVNGRASVMDYPHPYIKLTNGEIDFTDAYDVGIGEWDKRTIIYGYSDFGKGADEDAELAAIIKATLASGLHYISDRDARPAGGMHPQAHLWDSGPSPVDELKRLTRVRNHALRNLGENNIPAGKPYAYLESVLVPVYLAHRYQVEGASKLIGGLKYSYALKGDGQLITEIVPKAEQQDAIDGLLETLTPGFLTIPEKVIGMIPPPPPGYGRHRELFKTYTGLGLDPLAAAESSINHTLSFMMHPQRLARIVEQNARLKGQYSVVDYMHYCLDFVNGMDAKTGMEKELKRIAQRQYINTIMQVAGEDNAMPQIIAAAKSILAIERESYSNALEFSLSALEQSSFHLYMLDIIEQFDRDPSQYKWPKEKEMPPGSPIGCGH